MFRRLQNLILTTSCFGFLSGCCLLNPNGQDQKLLSASQLRSQELFADNQGLVTAQQNLQGNVQALASERNMMAQQLGQLQNQLATANSRVDNLLVEREDLKGRHLGLLLDQNAPMISAGILPVMPVTGFRKDELTGLNKYESDILFDLGKAEIRSQAYSVIKDFSDRVKSGDALGQKILVVGHTDDQVIKGGYTAVKHPTNWHLSTDRANEVIQELIRLGIDPMRVTAMGYSKFQPLNDGNEETVRQRNRRVELYLVPDSTNVAQWDPMRSIN